MVVSLKLKWLEVYFGKLLLVCMLCVVKLVVDGENFLLVVCVLFDVYEYVFGVILIGMVCLLFGVSEYVVVFDLLVVFMSLYW